MLEHLTLQRGIRFIKNICIKITLVFSSSNKQQIDLQLTLKLSKKFGEDFCEYSGGRAGLNQTILFREYSIAIFLILSYAQTRMFISSPFDLYSVYKLSQDDVKMISNKQFQH